MEEKIKVMYLINSFSFGGAEKLVYEIAKRLNKDKFDVYICSMSRNINDISIQNAIQSELVSSNVKVHSFEKGLGRDRIKTLCKINGFLKSEKIDIIHTHCPSPDFFGKIAAFFSRTKIVFSTIHSTSGYSKFFEIFLSYLTTNYIVISKSVGKYSVDKLLINKEKVKLIYNGIDISQFNVRVNRNQVLSEFSIDPSKKVVVTVGRVGKEKGHHLIVSAAKNIIKHHSDIHFLIIGNKEHDSTFYANLLKDLKVNNLDSFFTFTGNRFDIPSLLGSSDIFVLPSFREGFALVTLESLASGLPLIASNVGSINEVINNGENGIILKENNSDSLGKALLKLLKNNNLVNRLATSGKKTSHSFTIEQTVLNHELLYSEKINNP